MYEEICSIYNSTYDIKPRATPGCPLQVTFMNESAVNTLQPTATQFTALQRTATQCVAVHCVWGESWMSFTWRQKYITGWLIFQVSVRNFATNHCALLHKITRKNRPVSLPLYATLSRVLQENVTFKFIGASGIQETRFLQSTFNRISKWHNCTHSLSGGNHTVWE